MENLFIQYQFKKTKFKLPPHWKLLTFASFKDNDEDQDVEKLVERALNNPVRSTPLRDHISPSDTVAVLIEDQTRSSPKKVILRALLKELDEIRIPRENVSIVLSLGTHRKLTKEEQAVVYGEDIVKAYPIINHDCRASDLVPVSKLKTGTMVRINKRVHEATFKIGIGSIFPHPMNGFGGGGKILFPGVADFDSILEHHLKYCFRKGSALGILKGNPFYEEICALSKDGGLDFIINSVLDHNDRLYDLVCGDPVEAHLAGIDLCKRIISMKFQKQAHVAVISSFPYTEGTQIMKPLAPASEITKKDGVIILVADCTVPLSDAYLNACERFRMKYNGRIKEGVFEHFDNNRLIMEDGAPELNMSMAQALLAQAEFKVILVSKDVPREATERLGFLFAEDLERAFSISESFYPNPEVHVIPSGGVILPILEN